LAQTRLKLLAASNSVPQHDSPLLVMLPTQAYARSSLDSTRGYSPNFTTPCLPLDQGICVDMLLGQQLLEAAGSLSVQEGCSVTRGNRQSATGVRTGSLMNVPLLHSSSQDALRRCTCKPNAHVCTPVSMPAVVAGKHVGMRSTARIDSAAQL